MAQANATLEKPEANVPTAITLEMILARIDELVKKVDALEKTGGRGSRQSQREMTDDDARQVLGELSKMKHNDAADKLGLSYGQVYSARLGYTFKHIRKELSDAGVKNEWLEGSHNDR
jgi:hypothetical protein